MNKLFTSLTLGILATAMGANLAANAIESAGDAKIHTNGIAAPAAVEAQADINVKEEIKSPEVKAEANTKVEVEAEAAPAEAESKVEVETEVAAPEAAAPIVE